MHDSSLVRIHLLTGLYATALTTATIALTFLALKEGLGLGGVALLTALCAAAQVVFRLPLGAVLNRISDRSLMLISVVLLAVSMLAVIVLPGVVGLIVAQAVLGASRAGFWTGGQTHVVRLAPRAARGMAHNMFVTGIGNSIGPLLAGAATSLIPTGGAWVSLALGVACVVVALGLARLPQFHPHARDDARRVGLRFGVMMASAASLASGLWHISLTALAPAALSTASWSDLSIGIVVALTNAMFLGGVLLSGRADRRHFIVTLLAGSVLVAVGVAGVAAIHGAPVLAIGMLVASGAGAGTLMTLSPAVAAESVDPEERGQAIVVTGTYRAGALLGGPLLAWAATLILPVGGVMVILGALAGAPALVAWIFRPRDSDPGRTASGLT